MYHQSMANPHMQDALKAQRAQPSTNQYTIATMTSRERVLFLIASASAHRSYKQTGGLLLFYIIGHPLL